MPSRPPSLRPSDRASSWGLLGALVAAACAAPGPPDAPPPDRPPNVVLLLADDLGWCDVRANDPLGRTFYETPRLDRLAAEGLRHTNAYSDGPNCAPSRAALATGRRFPAHPIYTVASGARGAEEARGLVPVENRTDLPTEHVTLAERLRDRGYATWFLGKWHLGTPGRGGPLEHGFDVNVGGYEAGHPKSYFPPYGNPELADGPEGEYLTDRLAEEACRLIVARDDRPFFLQLSFYAVHTPLQAPADDVARFRERPGDRGHGHARYGALVGRLDRAVGVVLDALEDEGIVDETLVVFASDNGGLGGYVAEGLPGRDVTSQAPLRGGKGMLYEGGIRVPLFVRWPGVVPAGSVTDEPVSLLDLHPTLCAAAGRAVDGAPLDGVDLRGPWTGAALGERTLVWYFPGYLQRDRTTFRTRPAIALRRGRHKALHFFEDGRTEVYDLVDDPGERTDLAPADEALTLELRTAMEDWLGEVDAPRPRRP